jgi:hypothetical protein
MAPVFNRVLATVFVTVLATLAGITPLKAGRMPTEGESYQEMFDKADLVVIATALATKETAEQSKLLGTVNVVGVETEFRTRLTLKGAKEVRKFVLHHYREADDQSIANGPALIHIPPGRHPDFLMFLVREKAGRYAPVTGQTDPILFSVLELRSGVTPEGPEGW